MDVWFNINITTTVVAIIYWVWVRFSIPLEEVVLLGTQYCKEPFVSTNTLLKLGVLGVSLAVVGISWLVFGVVTFWR